MDQYKEDAKMINEKVGDIETKLWGHKEKLMEIAKHVRHPKQHFLLSEFDDIMNNWKSMVEMQRIVLNRMEQELLLNSIEVTGLPEKYAKDTEGVAQILSKLLHISINVSYIKSFERIGSIDAHPDAECRIPRTLIIHLINENIKKRILTVANSVVLSVIDSDVPMYIKEHLTPKNELLLKKAREEALRCDINNVWVENGKILVRRSDNTFVYEVRCDADIERMALY